MTMAYIKKLPSGNYQAQIRLKDLKPIIKTFKTKRDATTFVRKVEGDLKLARSLGDPVTTRITLATLIEDFLDQYDKKNCNIGTRLNWWKKQYGSISLAQFNKNHVVEGIKVLRY